MEYVRQNCHTVLKLQQVAEVAGLSKFHFHRLFRVHCGKTVKQFATECQVELSKRLLLQGATVRDVAQRAGFANQSHFTWRFKVITGITPAKWLKTHSASH
jgi:AraC-like DNA-binding protein